MPDSAPRKGLASSPALSHATPSKKNAKAGTPATAGGDEGTIKVASKKESKAKPVNGAIKLKKQAPRHSNPGNWKDGGVIDSESKKSKANASSVTAASPGPVVNLLDDSARETFATGYPLEDYMDITQCKHCKKSILVTAAKAHIAGCLRLKKEKAQRKKEAREARERAKEQAAREEQARKEEEEGGAGDDSSDGDDEDEKPGGGAGKTTKKAAKKTGGDGDKTGKKRKADGDPDGGKGGPKPKKKKDEPKPKAVKPKGPVDVERQCGVITPTGQPCARSLTCKTHSMGAKRAVPGRSLPYDMLLTAYQKKNQAKQQKAALDANAPLEDEDEANAGPVDSDEETALVMTALSRWKPQPVVPQPVFTPIKRQYQLSRLHEQLQMATNGGRLNIFKVAGFGAQRLPDGHPGLMADNEDAPGEPDHGMGMGPASRRSSSYSVSMQSAHPHHPPQRQPSVAAGRA
ncbi:hypothetical protein RB597_004957 [Gaeumannomyces tritici]